MVSGRNPSVYCQRQIEEKLCFHCVWLQLRLHNTQHGNCINGITRLLNYTNNSAGNLNSLCVFYEMQPCKEIHLKRAPLRVHGREKPRTRTALIALKRHAGGTHGDFFFCTFGASGHITTGPQWMDNVHPCNKLLFPSSIFCHLDLVTTTAIIHCEKNN